MRARSWRAQTTWRLTAVLALAPMTLAFAYLIVMLFFVFL